MKSNPPVGKKPKRTTSSDEWFSPPWLIDWAHQVLGGRPDFDPASCGRANLMVQAKCYDFLDGEDGRVWRNKEGLRDTVLSPGTFNSFRTAFMNPPFSRAKEFTQRLTEWADGHHENRFFAILPANVNSAYWQGLVNRYQVFLPEKRVAVVNGATGEVGTAPRGNVCVVMNVPPTDMLWSYAPVRGIWI